MENEQKFDTGKIALWTGVGCIVLVIGMVLGCALSIGGLLWLSRAPQNITVSVDAPIQIDNGDNVEFIVHVTNDGTETVTITGINLGANYLDGIAIESVTPAYDEVFPPVESAFGENFQNYNFSILISPAETVSVTFNGTAIASGDYGGSLDICIDSNFSCLPKVIRTVVR
jgi:hypothetical protein